MAGKTVRKSILAPYIDGLLEEKHANGYSYKPQELILDRFDSYCVSNHLDTLNVSKDFLSGWMASNGKESSFNVGKRVSCVRQLMKYMAGCGIQVYIPHDFCHFSKPAPHIFEPEEIAAFFKEVDSYRPHHTEAQTRMANEYRLLFRWYCCCGLRNSEAAGIASENVDLEEGILTILDSKGGKDRLVYLPEDLRESSDRYLRYLTSSLGYRPEWFFPGIRPDKPIPNTSVDSVFNRFWSQTAYAGCSNKPTVHDFRFTYVVNRMNLWAQEGLDLKVMMPYLSRYLGHRSENETFYYYYLVQDAFRTVEQKDTYACEVIPEVKHG